VLCCCQKVTLAAPMAKFWGRVALQTKQTAHPSLQGVYLRLVFRQRWMALQTPLFQQAPGGAIFPTSLLLMHSENIVVIVLVINIFLSSFNNVDLLHSMLADCCMPWRQEWGTMAAVGGRRLPWLACVYFV
jgi:hypothetical protein